MSNNSNLPIYQYSDGISLLLILLTLPFFQSKKGKGKGRGKGQSNFASQAEEEEEDKPMPVAIPVTPQRPHLPPLMGAHGTPGEVVDLSVPINVVPPLPTVRVHRDNNRR